MNDRRNYRMCEYPMDTSWKYVFIDCGKDINPITIWRDYDLMWRCISHPVFYEEMLYSDIFCEE